MRLLRQIDQPFSDDTALNAAASVLLILFVMLVAVLQLNLLIAMLTCSYEVSGLLSCVLASGRVS